MRIRFIQPYLRDTASLVPNHLNIEYHNKASHDIVAGRVVTEECTLSPSLSLSLSLSDGLQASWY